MTNCLNADDKKPILNHQVEWSIKFLLAANICVYLIYFMFHFLKKIIATDCHSLHNDSDSKSKESKKKIKPYVWKLSFCLNAFSMQYLMISSQTITHFPVNSISSSEND